MKDEMRALALCALVLMIMYFVGEGIIQIGRTLVGALK